MCGICGIYHYATEQPADAIVVRRMAAALVHRGPDDEGMLVDGAVALASCKLVRYCQESGFPALKCVRFVESLIWLLPG